MKARNLIPVLAGAALFLAAQHALAKKGPEKSSPPATPAAKQAALVNALEAREEGYVLRYPASWSVAPREYANAYQLLNVLAGKLESSEVGNAARILILTETGRDHADALRRLKEIALEEYSPSTFLAIGGWPALQRRHLAPVDRVSVARPQASDEEMSLRLTTAIAAGSRLVRLQAFLPPGTSPQVADEVEAIGRSASFAATATPSQLESELAELRRGPASTPPPTPPGGSASPESSEPEASSSAPFSGSSDTALSFNRQIITGVGELEIAVSTNGRSIVVGTNSGYVNSQDAGQTFTTSTGLGNNDPSLGVGNSGAFYAANIGGSGGTCTTAISRSTNGGQSFTFVANAAFCPASGLPMCFPDQEHIASDRFNADTVGGGDRLYSVWRDFSGSTNCPNSGSEVPSIVCSNDGGQTWSTKVGIAGCSDRPRVVVGQDSFVYVVCRGGSNNVVVQKYSPCTSGAPTVATVGAAVTVATVSDINPVPGVDRSANLGSQMVAVDDTNPNHIYVAYATPTSGSNDDVILQDSTDGGTTFPLARAVRLNQAVSGRRFMPWVCSVGGAARVSWYDQRKGAGGTDNSLTDFFCASAGLDGSGSLIKSGTEFQVNTGTDSTCQTATNGAWSCSVDASQASEMCSAQFQPALAGVCVDGSGNNTGSCDFSDCGTTNCGSPMNTGGACQCPSGSTCQCGGGCPTYGDYNGDACGAGRVYVAWASGVTPEGNQNPSGISVFFDQRLVCCVPQIQVPGSVQLPDTCVGATSTATLNVCNTGKENLEVTSITDNSTQFAVTTPSSGYPVVISPDFCFPFQVTFTPTSAGLKTATITINSNDPVNPSVQVQASGTGTVPDVRVSGSTAFGNVCAGATAENVVNVCNVGGCNLNVASAVFDPPCTDFTLINNPFPAPVSPDFCAPLTIRFTPTSAGTKSCTLKITTDDPDTPMILLTVTGNTPTAAIDVPPDMSFPAEVIQSMGACNTKQPFPISNTGTCPLTITSIAIAGPNPDLGDYGLSGLPSFPIILEPGHIAGEGDLKAVFAPTALDRDRLGNIQVTYVSDALTGATTQITRDLCGEGVRTGARVLVTSAGVPLATVDSIRLQRLTANRNQNLLDTVDVARNLALQTVDPDGVCPTFQYHREYGTVSNPIQLAPGSYNLTVSAMVGGKMKKKTVGFDVTTCDFNQNIVVELP